MYNNFQSNPYLPYGYQQKPNFNMPNYDGLYTLGACDNDTKSVYINDMLSDQQIWKVLCHEITHAAMFSYGIDLSLEQEELLADLIATYGYEIIEVTNTIFSKLKGE